LMAGVAGPGDGGGAGGAAGTSEERAGLMVGAGSLGAPVLDGAGAGAPLS